jgi:hypothetical protein
MSCYPRSAAIEVKLVAATTLSNLPPIIKKHVADVAVLCEINDGWCYLRDDGDLWLYCGLCGGLRSDSNLWLCGSLCGGLRSDGDLRLLLWRHYQWWIRSLNLKYEGLRRCLFDELHYWYQEVC